MMLEIADSLALDGCAAGDGSEFFRMSNLELHARVTANARRETDATKMAVEAANKRAADAFRAWPEEPFDGMPQSGHFPVATTARAAACNSSMRAAWASLAALVWASLMERSVFVVVMRQPCATRSQVSITFALHARTADRHP